MAVSTRTSKKSPHRNLLGELASARAAARKEKVTRRQDVVDLTHGDENENGDDGDDDDGGSQRHSFSPGVFSDPPTAENSVDYDVERPAGPTPTPKPELMPPRRHTVQFSLRRTQTPPKKEDEDAAPVRLGSSTYHSVEIIDLLSDDDDDETGNVYDYEDEHAVEPIDPASLEGAIPEAPLAPAQENVRETDPKTPAPQAAAAAATATQERVSAGARPQSAVDSNPQPAIDSKPPAKGLKRKRCESVGPSKRSRTECPIEDCSDTKTLCDAWRVAVVAVLLAHGVNPSAALPVVENVLRVVPSDDHSKLVQIVPVMKAFEPLGLSSHAKLTVVTDLLHVSRGHPEECQNANVLKAFNSTFCVRDGWQTVRTTQSSLRQYLRYKCAVAGYAVLNGVMINLDARAQLQLMQKYSKTFHSLNFLVGLSV